MSHAKNAERDAGRRRFKPYPAYKESGVEWRGEIPAHWTARRLKFVAGEQIKNGIGEAGAYDDPEWPRYVRITDIAGPRSLRDGAGNRVGVELLIPRANRRKPPKPSLNKPSS